MESNFHIYFSIDEIALIFDFFKVEGITLILEKNIADQYDFIKYEFECAWIQLEIHSSLEAVGLTAAFSKALSEVNKKVILIFILLIYYLFKFFHF